jgi:hypothetical protein
MSSITCCKVQRAFAWVALTALSLLLASGLQAMAAKALVEPLPSPSAVAVMSSTDPGVDPSAGMIPAGRLVACERVARSLMDQCVDHAATLAVAYAATEQPSIGPSTPGSTR